jgi:hypothetical protein
VHLEVADSEVNATAFGYLHARRGRSGYPLVRMAALVGCGTRSVLEAAFDKHITAEKTLAQRLLGGLCPGMLLLADRNFDGYDLWGQTRDTGAHLLWRAKGVRLLPCLTPLPDGSYLSFLPGRTHRKRPEASHPLRVIEFHLTVATSDGGERTEHYRLLTTLTDHRRHPAEQLAALYHQRWEIETAYFGLKVTLRAPDRVLRSQNPIGVEQEIYAYLVVYQVLRRGMHHSARLLDVDPDRISFTVVLRAARHSVITADHQRPTDSADQAFHRARTDGILPPRRSARVGPRAVKRPVSPFAQRQIKALRESRTARHAIYTIRLRQADALLITPATA